MQTNDKEIQICGFTDVLFYDIERQYVYISRSTAHFN